MEIYFYHRPKFKILTKVIISYSRPLDGVEFGGRTKTKTGSDWGAANTDGDVALADHGDGDWRVFKAGVDIWGRAAGVDIRGDGVDIRSEAGEAGIGSGAGIGGRSRAGGVVRSWSFRSCGDGGGVREPSPDGGDEPPHLHPDPEDDGEMVMTDDDDLSS